MSARVIFRLDWTSPPPLPAAALLRVHAVAIGAVPGKKTWREVRRCGRLLGYVTSRMHGQYWRATSHQDWWPATDDISPDDPPHARAVLHLLDYVDSEASCS